MKYIIATNEISIYDLFCKVSFVIINKFNWKKRRRTHTHTTAGTLNCHKLTTEIYNNKLLYVTT